MAARPTARLCYVCGTTFPDVGARLAHLGADHPGYRIEWEGRNPAVVDPEGGRRVLTKAEQARMRRAGAPAQRRPVRTIESLTSSPDPSDPVDPPGDDAPPVMGSGTKRRRSTVEQPYVRITPEYRAADMRATVAEAFTLDMLATIFRDLSMVISEADGAGEDGYLSRVQAVQLANLTYDVTLDLIVNRFRGNVGRFKMVLAAILILASKGRVHARAIGANLTRRNAERNAARHVAAVAAAQEAPATAPIDPYVLDLTDPIAALRLRQQGDAGRRAD